MLNMSNDLWAAIDISSECGGYISRGTLRTRTKTRCFHRHQAEADLNWLSFQATGFNNNTTRLHSISYNLGHLQHKWPVSEWMPPSASLSHFPQATQNKQHKNILSVFKSQSHRLAPKHLLTCACASFFHWILMKDTLIPGLFSK